MERTRPHGRVIGIDLIPAQPPRGVATFQGDFLSPTVQSMVKTFIEQAHKRSAPSSPARETEEEDEVDIERPSYIDMERHATEGEESEELPVPGKKSADALKGRLVDVSETWGE